MDSFTQWWQKAKQPDPATSFFRKNEERNKSFFVFRTGNTPISHMDFIDHLKRHVRLQQVSTVDQCDFILVFCPVISRAGTDVEAALKKLNNESETKPAVLVVLHHTFDPECVVPDSSRAVHRENTITVDCLFHEDERLLQCHKNTESLAKTLDYINPQIRRYVFVLVTGNTLNFHQDFIDRLNKQVRLQQVSTVDQCDFILVFCPVVSRGGTDVEAAVRKLQNTSETKPAVVVVLHHTFDPECVVPDSSRAVHRQNTVTVDCLFHEDKGFLQCHKNDESLSTTLDYINPQERQDKKRRVHEMRIILQQLRTEKIKHFKEIERLQTETKTQLMERDKQLEETERRLTERETQLMERDKQLEETERRLTETKTQLMERDKQFQEKEETGGASQCRDKLENMTSETKPETQLQEKERQLEEMRTELKKLKTELAEKNEELKKKESLLPLSEGHLMREHVQDKGKDRHLREMTQDEKKLKEVKAELDNTIQNLEQKKKELQIVSKHLSEGIKVCEINKSELDSMQKKLQEKNKQIQEIIS